MIDASSYLRKQFYKLRMIPSQVHLSLVKRGQKPVFNALCRDFAETYHNLKKYDDGQFTSPVWQKMNTEIENALFPSPTFTFLRVPLIKATMVINDFGEVLERELDVLERVFASGRLRVLLEEDYVGNPLIINSRYLTSHNSIHHLYHLTRFLEKTKTDLGAINTVVEWGGGYGNLAKIFRRLKPAKHTYIIIDTPLFSSVQWLYLSTALGAENVKLLRHPGDAVDLDKINLMPICFLDQHQMCADLFVSTWALSESSKFSQDYVVAQEWFKSPHLLIAHQDSSTDSWPDASRVGALARSSGALTEEIDFLPGNYYAFR